MANQGELHVEPNEAEKSEFVRLTSASREALEKLDRYVEILVEWNQKFNLVAPSTLPHIWSRHFLDSAQLLPLIKSYSPNLSLADLGSGAGFPGLILNILGIAKTHLIESTGKKADFLQTVISELKLDAIVHKCRIEDLEEFRVDIITARALAPLKELLPLVAPLIHKNSLCLFLKGKTVDLELTEAKKYWMFDCEKTQSLSDASGSVLAIRNLKNNAAIHRKFPRRN